MSIVAFPFMARRSCARRRRSLIEALYFRKHPQNVVRARRQSTRGTQLFRCWLHRRKPSPQPPSDRSRAEVGRPPLPRPSPVTFRRPLVFVFAGKFDFPVDMGLNPSWMVIVALAGRRGPPRANANVAVCSVLARLGASARSRNVGKKLGNLAAESCGAAASAVVS
jgi:hypothetical protein